MREVRQPDARGVTDALRREVANVDPLDSRLLRLFGHDVIEPSDDVRIHAGAADVLSYLVHYEDVGIIEGKLGRQLFRLSQKGSLGGDDFPGQNAAYQGGFFVAVFYNGQAKQHLGLLDNYGSQALDKPVKSIICESLVINFRSFVLAHSDEHHFHEAAFDFTLELGVGLYSIHYHHVIRFRRVFVQEDRDSLPGLADLDGRHARLDRASHRLFRDAVMTQDRSLSFSGRPAMASHGRKDERAPS